MNDVRGSEANMVPVEGVTRSVEEHGAPVVTVERLEKALATIGYPPIKQEQSNAGPSAHYRHDNQRYAALILAECERLARG